MKMNMEKNGELWDKKEKPVLTYKLTDKDICMDTCVQWVSNRAQRKVIYAITNSKVWL